MARLLSATLTLLPCFALCLFGGCTSSKDEPASASTKADADGGADDPSGPAPVSEDEARAVFDAWLKAQTEHDFDAYSALYAEDFEGIKRNGHTTTHLEREAWLESREKGFDRKFKITATDLKFSLSEGGEHERGEAGAMLVRFTQRWSTPSYADIGPKELIVARRGDAAMLVHEEMLASHITRRKGKTDPPLMTLMLDAPFVVLGTGDPEWVDESKPATLLADATPTKPLVRENVDKAMLDWVGREVEVVGDEDERCKAKITELVVVGRVQESYEYDDELWEIYEAGGEPTEEQVARSMWSMISPDLFTLGKLDRCAGDLAVPVDATEYGTLTSFAAGPLDAALAESAREAFVGLKDYRDEQKTFEDEFEGFHYDYEAPDGGKPADGKPEPWDEGAEVVEQLWTAGDDRYLFRSVSIGGDCGDYTASMWAVWRVGEGDALELVASGPESGDFSGWSPLTPTRLVRWHDTLWLRTAHELYEVRSSKRDGMLVYATEPVFFGCPC